MSKKILCIALLLLSACLSTQAFHSKRVPSKLLLCCTKVSAADVSAGVRGKPDVQPASANGHCVKALIFKTAEGKVCVDPKAGWAQKYITNMKKP